MCTIPITKMYIESLYTVFVGCTFSSSALQFELTNRAKSAETVFYIKQRLKCHKKEKFVFVAVDE